MVVVPVVESTQLVVLEVLVVVVDIQLGQEELEIQTVLQHIKEILVEQETQEVMVLEEVVVVPVVLGKLLPIQVQKLVLVV
jgi:hypothetical protein